MPERSSQEQHDLARIALALEIIAQCLLTEAEIESRFLPTSDRHRKLRREHLRTLATEWSDKLSALSERYAADDADR